MNRTLNCLALINIVLLVVLVISIIKISFRHSIAKDETYESLGLFEFNFQTLQGRHVLSNYSKKYKPVIVIHGLNDKNDSLGRLVTLIIEKHPQTDVYYVDVLHSKWSFSPLWLQVMLFYQELRPIMQKSPNGVILIGFSQGGLIARGIIQSRKHNIHTFISLSSPQAGQYGDNFIDVGPISRWLLKQEAWRVLYTSFGQKFSFANYWNDPHHQELYLQYCAFLPYIDNTKSHPLSTHFKRNFIQLKRLILIGGPDDGVISPWESSHFSFYNEKDEVVNFKQRPIFTEDLFGLKTLYEEKKVTVYEVPGVKHLEWHENEEIIEKYILPWLD